MFDREKFAKLCAEESAGESCADSIGLYKEKRLHRILKLLSCENMSAHEVKVGNYVADVFEKGRITEIQTGSFYPLREKLAYYLCETDYAVRLVHPVIAEKRIVRIERESGEVIRSRRSPKRVEMGEIMREIYWISELVKNERLEIVVLYISADEYRYSEAVRYRRSGKYDSELLPREILSEERFCGVESYKFLLDGTPERFSAKEYGARKKLRGRELYSTLNLLTALGLLEREKGTNKAYEYRRVNKT